MHQQHRDTSVPPQQPQSSTDRSGGASCRFGHSPVGGASEPEPAPGVAGPLPRQGAREAAIGGGSRQGGRRAKARIREREQRRAHSVRLSESELAAVSTAADTVGMSVAGFLAHSGLAAASDLDRTAAAIADRRDTLTALFSLQRQLGHIGNNLNQVAHALNSGVYPDGVEATLTAVRQAAEGIRRLTARMTGPDAGGPAR
ncbi:MobC family plasmid mobilization relaxosome protein [Streptomyces sp. NRRL F-5630]|uniref:MobC family plasmid mobilization relaxosome protein n=1 Tax=unclassified Streptomyces TaxID=2593676 RepID=UPI002D21B7D8|nr:MobC family plasmid mobilization relaxosome protein [Streptomyces sp. NRRL F-5630]